MNKINPLYIVALLLFLLIIVVYKNSSMQEKMQYQQTMNKQTLQEAKELASLKKAFKSEGRNRAMFESILNHPHLKKFNVEKDVAKGRYEIKYENLNKQAFDALSSKLFNSTLKIDSFTFNRLNDNNISVKAGIIL